MTDDIKTSAHLVLDGKIFIVETDADGNEVSKEELDGDVCLKALLSVLEDALKHPALDMFLDNLKSENEENNP